MGLLFLNLSGKNEDFLLIWNFWIEKGEMKVVDRGVKLMIGMTTGTVVNRKRAKHVARGVRLKEKETLILVQHHQGIFLKLIYYKLNKKYYFIIVY